MHFKAGITGNPNVVKEASDMQSLLNGFESEVKAQCTALEASVAEIDKIQEVVHHVYLYLPNIFHIYMNSPIRYHDNIS